jgi:hypothetical protein
MSYCVPSTLIIFDVIIITDWRWQSNDHDDIYKRILRKFLDSRDSEYSIQMIGRLYTSC